MSNVTFRPIEDTDSERMIEIVGACYDLYPNCVLDLETEEPEMKAPATEFEKAGKQIWVMERDGQMIGCVGLADQFQELVKLYLDPALHGQGLGRELCGFILKTAAEFGQSELYLWTDTRFTAAHGLYESFGFQLQPESRDLNDLSKTTEYLYRLKMEPTHAL